MARYLLAESPLKYLKSGGIADADASILHKGAWVDGEGLWVAACELGNYFSYGVGMIKLDGVFCRTANYPAGWYRAAFLPTYGADGENYLTYYDDASLKTHRFHRRLSFLQIDDNGVEITRASPYINYTRTRVAPGLYGIRALDIRSPASWYVVRFVGTSEEQAEDGDYWEVCSDLVYSLADAPATYYAYPTISQAEVAGEYYLTFSNGRYAKYRDDTGEVTQQGKFIDDLSAAAGWQRSFTHFSRELGVFVTMARPDVEASAFGEPWYLRVYANEGKPVHISAPVIDSPLSEMAKTRVFTTVTGAQADGVERALVNWELTGSGSLMHDQTITGEDGVAENWFIGPDLASDVSISVSTDGPN